MTRKILMALCILLLLCPVASAAPEGVEEARQSVVHLYGLGTDRDTGQRIRWTGTGFAVGQAGEDSSVFLTNWHVATGSGRCEPEDMQLWLLREGTQFDDAQIPLPPDAVQVSVLATTQGYPDVAVVQTVQPVSGYKALPLISSRRVEDGSEVYALGFNGFQDSGGGSGAEDVIITSGVVAEHLVLFSAGGTRSIIHTAPIRHGNSGGPLVDSTGAVVALNAYGFEEEANSALFCAVYTDYAMKLLDRLQVDYTAVRAPANRWILFAGGAVLLTGFLLFFVGTKRQRKTQTQHNEQKEVL